MNSNKQGYKIINTFAYKEDIKSTISTIFYEEVRIIRILYYRFCNIYPVGSIFINSSLGKNLFSTWSHCSPRPFHLVTLTLQPAGEY